MAGLARTRWTLALVATLVMGAGAALPATAAAKPKKAPRYVWTVQMETHKYYHSNCTAWGVNRRITDNEWKSQRESGSGTLGGTSVVELSGNFRKLYNKVDTHPDGNQIPEDKQESYELPKERERSSSVKVRKKGQLRLHVLIGPAFPNVRLLFAPLKPGKSITLPISESQFEQQEPLEEGCTAVHGRTEVKGSATIKRVR